MIRPTQNDPQAAGLQAVDEAGEQYQAPDVAPTSADAFRLGGETPRVMRLSRKTLAALGTGASLAIGGALIYALQPRTPQKPENLYDTNSRNRADLVTGAPADYSNVPKLGPPLPGDLGRPIVAAQQKGQNVPIPPIGSAPSDAARPDPQSAAAQEVRAQGAQERESARTSQLFLAGQTGNIGSGAPAALAQGPALSNAAAQYATAATATSTSASSRQAFLEPRSKATQSPERIQRLGLPHVLQAGSIIPAALITGIRSDLPGQITAQVTQNVYDSPTGKTLLIPQGARLIGTYDSDIAAGQRRVLLAWDRLIFPGGHSILLGRLPGADVAGMAGLEDQTDYHWGNMLKAALISTLLGVGTQLAASDDNDLVRALRLGTQETVSQTGRQLVQRQLNVPPTLTVRPGFAFRIVVTRDLVLEPLASGASQ